MIAMKGVSKAFSVNGSALPIVDITEWSVPSGERIALTGPSGSGKSTILHLLSGVLAADGGEITAFDHALHRLTEAQRDRYRARYVGYIFQDFHLIGSLSARQNVELVAPASWSRTERRSRVDGWFERVGLASRQHHLPAQLSRGQAQRVAIIRALIGSPPLVLADEPTGSLDWETAGDIMRLLLTLCEAEGSTLLTVTHDKHLAELYPNRIDIGELNRVQRFNKAEGEAAGAAKEEKAG